MTKPTDHITGFPTFLSGRYFTAQEVQDIQETIESCGLSWTELVETICEHLQWVTPAGRNKADSCAKALMKLERQGLLRLPARTSVGKGKEKAIEAGTRTDPEKELSGTVRDFEPVEVAPVLGRHLSIKLCLKGDSSGLLKSSLEHGIELRKSRGDAACWGSPSTILQG